MRDDLDLKNLFSVIWCVNNFIKWVPYLAVLAIVNQWPLFVFCKILIFILSREVFFTLIPVFNLVVLALMLWAEIKARGFPNKTVRPLIIISLMVMQLLMFILFGFLQKSARIFTLTLIQGTIGMIYLEVGWYFLKKSSRVLKNKQRWFKVL